jgi:hypothetical protein
MSRSRKKPIYKDHGFRKDEYWKIIRREWSQTIKGWRGEEIYLRHPKSIVNDWDYSDYQIIFQESRPYWGDEEPKHWFGYTNEEVKPYTRK